MSDSANPWTVAHQAPLSWDSPGKNTGVGSHALLQAQHCKSTIRQYNIEKMELKMLGRSELDAGREELP